MVTLKNNFGVEPDKDRVVMNVSEGSNNDTKSSLSGHPKAVLLCRRNSHPFKARTLILNTPAKIGRSVARARPSSNNGIFDCKVLSRNHAIIWYEYDTGKFMIQDTKSSNGTFVNNQRLSKGGETSLPKEFFSRDIVQFGVNVLENQRKGNEESDENNHIVTHGCIVATVKLFHPNGKESKSGQSFSHQPPSSIPQAQIYKLELIIHEAQQREERLHDKLEELQLINGKLELACQEALTNRFEETRLLSKIEHLEKQVKVMNKIKSSGTGNSSEKLEAEIQQLLVDIEKVQSVGRVIQERQHRKLLESEQKLVEAQRVAFNLELEVITLREQAALGESHLQDMQAKCTAYCQTIETLQNSLDAQIEQIQKLETQVREFQDAECDFNVDFSAPSKLDKCRFISDNSEEEILKKDSQEVVLEWCKNYEETDKIDEKDFINENDKAEWLTDKLDDLSDTMCRGLNHISNCIGQLESSLLDVQLSKIKLDKLYGRKRELALKLDLAKMPIEENEKTEEDFDGEHQKIVKPVIPLSNEKITELENELKEQEELLSQAESHLQESEYKRARVRRELDATVKRCEKLNLDAYNLKNLLRNHMKSVEESTNSHRQKIIKLESKMEELENENEKKWLEMLDSKSLNTEAKITQTSPIELVSAGTNTEFAEETTDLSQNIKEESEVQSSKLNEKEEVIESETLQPTNDIVDGKTNDSKLEKSDDSSVIESSEENRLKGNSENDTKVKEPDFLKENERTACNLGAWEKIQKLQGLLTMKLAGDSSFSNIEVREMKSLMNLLTEDLVDLLLREQEVRRDKQILQDKLDKSLSQSNISAVGLAIHLKTLMAFSVTAVVAYFLYYTFL